MDAQIDPLSEEFACARYAELKERVSPKRLKHIEGVANTARKLAREYGGDEDKAYLAGLLHDWDKGFDDESIRKRAQELGISTEVGDFLILNMPQVLHGPTAAAALHRDYPQIPEDVIVAIRDHTTASTKPSDLDKIIYIADAIEPTRKFDVADKLRKMVGKCDLDELFFEVYKFWTIALIERNKSVHPDTMTIWNLLVSERHNKSSHKNDSKNKNDSKSR